jgi:hypothetical protein
MQNTLIAADAYDRTSSAMPENNAMLNRLREMC